VQRETVRLYEISAGIYKFPLFVLAPLRKQSLLHDDTVWPSFGVSWSQECSARGLYLP